MNGNSSTRVYSECMDKPALALVSWHVRYSCTVNSCWGQCAPRPCPYRLWSGILYNDCRATGTRLGLAALQCVWFVRGSFDADDFWSLVFHCRTGGGKHARTTNYGWYDVAIGPAAASWRQRLTIHDADQV